MANLMGVTNPVPGYDGPNNTRTLPTTPKPTDTSIQNIPDPSRVGRADARTDQKGAGNALDSDALRYDSNLQFFLQALRDAPDVQAELAKAITWIRGLVTMPGLTQGVVEEMAQFLQMLRLDADGFKQFFLDQMAAGNRFSGPLLSLLRQAYQETPSQGVRDGILAFLKRYSDFSSTEHVAGNLSRLLRQLPEYMPKSWSGKLLELSARLENSLQAGDRTGALKLLQGEIMPYLSTYVERTHDMGTARGLISLLMLNVARYENGGEEGLLAAFRQLSGYGDTLSGLNQLDDKALLKLLRENTFTQAARTDTFAEKLSDMASKALRGEFGAEAREAFQEIVRSILINESVFMPLRHGILPLEWENKMMYSEFWVDPDAEEDREQGGKSGGGGKIQFLFKLDIQGLGFLDMTLAAREGQVDLAVFGPDAVAAHQDQIAQDLKDILADHGLDGRSVRVTKSQRPLAITDVFPDLFEGKRSVNVKI